MVFLLFQLGPDRYALDVRQVAEVLPLLALKRIAHAPGGVVGVFDYRGTPVPVIDLALLTLGRPAEESLSTRVVVVSYAGSDGVPHLLGLIAEKATQTLQRAAEDFAPTGVTTETAPWLGPVCADAGGMVQWVEVSRLLPDAVRAALFQATRGP